MASTRQKSICFKWLNLLRLQLLVKSPVAYVYKSMSYLWRIYANSLIIAHTDIIVEIAILFDILVILSLIVMF